MGFILPSLTQATENPSIAYPWTKESVQKNLPKGTTLLYSRKGKDKEGKLIADEYRFEVTSTTETEIKISGSKIKNMKSTYSLDAKAIIRQWTKGSPFFSLLNSEIKVIGQEKISVTAGSFDCVVAEIKGFFGKKQKVWMIKNKPGVHAKVIQAGITYQLVNWFEKK